MRTLRFISSLPPISSLQPRAGSEITMCVRTDHLVSCGIKVPTTDYLVSYTDLCFLPWIKVLIISMGSKQTVWIQVFRLSRRLFSSSILLGFYTCRILQSSFHCRKNPVISIINYVFFSDNFPEKLL